MRRYLLLIFFVVLAAVLWQMRPWPPEHRALNAAFRGPAAALPATSDCPAIGADGRFDWHAVGSDAGLEQCLGVVARALKTPDAMADWLKAQGFGVVGPYDSFPPVRFMVGARWPQDGNPAIWPYGGALSRLQDRFSMLIENLESYFLRPAYVYWIVISYDNVGNVDVDAGPDYL